MSSEFDAYTERYEEAVERSIAFAGKRHAFFVEAKVRHLIGLARSRLGDPARLRMLDVGCGVGLTDRLLAPEVGDLFGVDVARNVVERAARDNPSVTYRTYDGRSLPFDDATLDLAFAICVLHHVPTADRPSFLAEMRRVTRPGGLVAVYEHNPLNPLTRLAVSRCEFDADAVLLGRSEVVRLMRTAGLDPVERSYILFFPFRSRGFAALERGLGWLPLGAQHCVAGRR